MPKLRPLEKQRFSPHGPLPQPLSVGDGLAVMLLCLKAGHELVAPESDTSETVFHVLEGEGYVREASTLHSVVANDTVHVLPGSAKALVAGDGPFTVMGIRRLRGAG